MKYDWALNASKLQRAIAKFSNDEKAVLAEYVRIGGKVVEELLVKENKMEEEVKPVVEAETVEAPVVLEVTPEEEA